jgi:hypothetical protein
MRPFREGDTHSTLGGHVEKVVAEINALDNDYVLKAGPTDLEQYFVDKVFVRPLVLHVDDRHIEDQAGVNVDVTGDFRRGVFPGERASVRGTRLVIAIPFEGDPMLWKLRASTLSMSGYPELTIRNDSVAFSISFPDDTANADEVRTRIDRETKALADAVTYLRQDVDQHNASAPTLVRQALERKRKLAGATSGVVGGLGIPVKRKQEQPAFALPVKRREQPAQRPAAAAGKYEPEPFLDQKEYEHILEVLRSMSLVMERSPGAFATLDEEAIRNHFLIQLNGHYEGSATGETFNAAGKTDILIRADNKNVFIAECKFWRGPKAFNESIDQLLGYLTWRDSKCALLVFNTTKDSGAVRQKMHEVMQSRPEHKKTLFHASDGDGRYILVRQSDPGREITVTTQLYDIPGKD